MHDNPGKEIKHVLGKIVVLFSTWTIREKEIEHVLNL